MKLSLPKLNSTKTKAFAGGLAAGVAVNYTWERLRLPGYQVSVGTDFPSIGLYVGADDWALMGTGLAMTAYGAYKKKEGIKWTGVGFVVGNALTKAVEMVENAIYVQPATAFRISQSNINQTMPSTFGVHSQINKGRYMVKA